MSTSPRGLAGVLLALLATSSLTLVVAQDNGDGDRRTITITVGKPAAPPATAVDGPDKDTRRDDALPLNDAAQDVVEDATATPGRFDLGGDLRGPDDAPAGVLDGPLASQEWPGCKTAFVAAFSSRRGVTPKAIGLHYTAGLNKPGWADLDGLTAYSNDTRNQVSWHFGVDREGHCTYNVPVNHKAWTISGLNSQTINVEMVGTGREPDYGGTAGMKTLTSIVQRVHRLYPRIPVTLAATDGKCTVTRPGVLTHWMGGPCSGGHIDIKPYDLEPIIRALAAGGITSVDKITCRKLNWWRTHGRPHGLPEQRAVRRRKALESRSVRCTPTGPVKAT